MSLFGVVVVGGVMEELDKRVTEASLYMDPFDGILFDIVGRVALFRDLIGI
jgi:hypothetical protein